MKLWLKVFLFSLTFMILAVDIVAYTILVNSFSSSVTRETNQTLILFDTISATVSRQILYERLKQSKILLSGTEIDKALNEIVAQYGSNKTHMIFYHDDKPVTSYEAYPLKNNSNFRDQVISGDQLCSTIIDDENKTFILMGSHMSLEGDDYVLFIGSDITPLYSQYDEQLQLVQIVSLVSAGILATIMLLFIFKLMHPLSRINLSINQLAKENYTLRIEEEGSPEFRELSRSINILAASVERNVKEIQNIADGRKRFIDSLAHEMKTPLTSILGFADILRIKRKVSDKEREDFSNIIFEEAKRLRNLSGKLLELFSSTNLPLDFNTIDIKEFIIEICIAVQPLLFTKHLQISCNVQEGITLYANAELFKSLFYNLIENAVKASNSGQAITLSCRSVNNDVMFDISDNGIGMTKEEIENATDLFYTSNPLRVSQKNDINLGIGLALCKEIVNRHNGTMKIMSQAKGGTTVVIAIPKVGMRSLNES